MTTRRPDTSSVALLEDQPERVFTRFQLGALLHQSREERKAPRSLSSSHFIKTLLDSGALRLVTIKPHRDSGSKAYRPFQRYVRASASAYEVALSLRSRSYLSHASALFLHGLSLRAPQTVYVNREQTPKLTEAQTLDQSSIDRAFGNRPRRSNYVFDFQGTPIVLLSGKSTGDLEVTQIVTEDRIPVRLTKLERTLIDITVRPIYSGGVLAVLRAFREAASRVSADTLVATLRKLDHTYPYHQAIGFYMMRAGYPGTALQALRALGLDYNFYLGNGISNAAFDKDWRVYYPPEL